MLFSQLDKIVTPQLNLLFQEFGFKFDKKGVGQKWLKPYNENIDFVIGITTAGRGCHFFAVTPAIDVYRYEYARIFHEITGVPLERCPIPFLFQTLGYLMPDPTYRTWDFTENNIEGMLGQLRHDLVRYGLPYMNEMLDLTKYTEEVQHVGWQGGYYFVPLLYAGLGEKEKALQYLDRFRAEYLKDPRPFVTYDYGDYYDKVKAYYSL